MPFLETQPLQNKPSPKPEFLDGRPPRVLGCFILSTPVVVAAVPVLERRFGMTLLVLALALDLSCVIYI